MEYAIECSRCGREARSLLDFRCQCGSPLRVKPLSGFRRDRIEAGERGLWRYSSFFPYVNEGEIVTLGEGWTPLVELSDDLFLKLDHLNPTGSFKDRGSAVLISALRPLLRGSGRYISEDSSGNAGASIAAYAARAGLRARIYVPEGASGRKVEQARAYGAEVIRVSGDRERVAYEAQRPEPGKIYIGHIYHPLFRDGIRSLAYELAEQFRWELPDAIYLPTSAGTLLLGVLDGLRHLEESGIIDGLPEVVACQTEQVSPLYHLLKGLKYVPPSKINSIADALIGTSPPLLDLMAEGLRDAGGDAEIVSEGQIFEAFVELASKGFFVEPSSAVAYAAYKKRLESGGAPRGERTLIVLTGSGLKSELGPARPRG
ncbi:MAG: pyridoxal-phosphate dependent enzyme [Candidatus Bathyarchaeia archaeon]